MTVETDEDDASFEPARLARTDITRGGIVLALAVAIGLLVVVRGLGTDSSVDLASVDAGGTDIGDAVTDGSDTIPFNPNDTGATGGTSGTVLPEDPGGTPDPASSTTAPGVSDGTADDTTTSQAVAETTTTAPGASLVARPAAEVRVLVLNGSGTQGIAARGTSVVEAAGHPVGAPKNAEPSPQLSAIYHLEGYDLEARDVAALYAPGLDDLVRVLDGSNSPIADTQNASVIVVIGSDGRIPVP